MAAEHTTTYGLAHHFDDIEQQREAGTLGMWAFLITEILVFGGMFMAYILYRTRYPESFAAASHHLDWRIGAFNTSVLIVSSLTMALAVYFSQTGSRRKLIVCLILTMVLGALFLAVTSHDYRPRSLYSPRPGFKSKWEG